MIVLAIKKIPILAGAATQLPFPDSGMPHDTLLQSHFI
jgi:hypothetical protein